VGIGGKNDQEWFEKGYIEEGVPGAEEGCRSWLTREDSCGVDEERKAGSGQEILRRSGSGRRDRLRGADPSDTTSDVASRIRRRFVEVEGFRFGEEADIGILRRSCCLFGEGTRICSGEGARLRLIRVAERRGGVAGGGLSSRSVG